MSDLNRSSDWKLTTTAATAIATVTQPAPPSGQVNYVTAISGSYGVAAQADGLLLRLIDGGTTIGNWHVSATMNTFREYDSPIRCHGAVELTLAASATATGAVTLDGYTK